MECLAGQLCGSFFFVKQAFESTQLLLHLGVNFEITRDDHFHLVYIVVDIAVFRVLALYILNQLALLGNHVCDFFEVL